VRILRPADHAVEVRGKLVCIEMGMGVEHKPATRIVIPA
jgi:hypothetical protein